MAIPLDNSHGVIKKKIKEVNMDLGEEDDEEFNDAMNMIEQSHYYESNGEIFCIDANVQTSPK